MLEEEGGREGSQAGRFTKVILATSGRLCFQGWMRINLPLEKAGVFMKSQPS